MGSGLHHCPRGNRMSGSTTPRPPISLHDRASPMLASPHPALHRYGLMLLDPIVPCWTRAPQLHIPSSSSPGADAWVLLFWLMSYLCRHEHTYQMSYSYLCRHEHILLIIDGGGKISRLEIIALLHSLGVCAHGTRSAW
uniref:Uncharacterized protein n=1 Tax=Triticum urartu TaxID=4572 RepID=A0A8R7VD28_TRIUA